jgi:hypothetical protein
MDSTQTYRCNDCGGLDFTEDEVDILRHSPVDKGYLACKDCIQSYRDKQKPVNDTAWMKEAFHQAEYKAQDFDREHRINRHAPRTEPVQHQHGILATFCLMLIADIRYMLSLDG